MLNKEEIKKIIPQREPFLMIDEVEEFVPGEMAIAYKNVDENEWYFKGHFPGNPIMPGVLIAESLAQAGAVAILSQEENIGKNALFGGIDKMKFKKMVVPGDKLKLEVKIIKKKGPIGVGEGIATVIVKGLQSEKTNNITVVVKKVAVLGVGSYVNYPVDYDNVGTVTVDAYIPKDDYTGKWRILDLGNYNSDGTYGTDYKPVRLISAGVPLNYYNCDNSSISVANLTTGFFTTPISVSEKNQYNYYRCGFKNEGGIITNINDVRKLFNNNVTAKNGGIPKVQAMTKEDWENLYDTMESTTTSYGADFYDLLAIPCKDREGKFAYTWLASTFSTNLLWYVSGENGNISGSRDDCLGIRPVVSLVSNVSIIKGTNGVWNIKNNS